jgi:hypothetical protein
LDRRAFFEPVTAEVAGVSAIAIAEVAVFFDSALAGAGSSFRNQSFTHPVSSKEVELGELEEGKADSWVKP